MYILYGGNFTRALVVEMVMLEGDIPYEIRAVDIVNHEHRTPEFLDINPAGLVPVLITPNGEVLYETPAINLYLAEHHELTHLAPGIGEPERGYFLSGYFYVHDELEPIMKRYYYPHRYGLREDDMPMVKARALENALERLSVINKRLTGKGPYHLGDRFSLVDLTTTYWTALIEYLGVLEPYPAVRQCMDLVRARPKLRLKFDEHKMWGEKYAQLQARGQGVR